MFHTIVSKKVIHLKDHLVQMLKNCQIEKNAPAKSYAIFKCRFNT